MAKKITTKKTSASKKQTSSSKKIPKIKTIIDKKRITAKQRLEKELISLLKDIDEEGLLFLLKQAQIITHNLQVDKINKDLENIQKKEQKIISSSMSPENASLFFDVEGSNDNSSFIFVTSLSRKIFILEEMRSIVNICHSAIDNIDAAKGLYRWFYNNRKDFIVENRIGNEKHPYLEVIYKHIIKNYKPKK